MKRIPISQYIRKNWLLVAILTCIFLSAVYPKLGSKNGPLHTEYSVKYGAVSLIFLISGVSLKTDSIFQTFRNYKLHLFIQAFTFVIIPLCCHIFTRFLAVFGINPWVLKGLMTVACMPPPVSSAVILTRAALGNETAAIFNSVLGSFLGIVITPILLLFNLGSTAIVPLMGTVTQLTTTVLLPLILGQVVRNKTRLGNFFHHRLPLNTISQCALLFVIYTTFCDTFETPDTGLSAPDILVTVFSVVVLQVAMMALGYQLSVNLMAKAFSRQDVITIVFCSTHKSLTLGIPILRIMFHGFSHLSQISLPLLVYHPTQIILGGFVVAQLKEWGLAGRGRRPPV